MSIIEHNYYGSYEASMKMPGQAGLLNGFFLYAEPDDKPREIDMEMMKYQDENSIGGERWELWMTIHNEKHPDYVLGGYLEDYDPNIEYTDSSEENYAEPGVIYQKKIDLTKFLGKSPEDEFNNYRINYYENYVSFEVNGVEVGRWNNSLGKYKLELLTSTFWATWLERYQYRGEPWEEEMKVNWIRMMYED